MAARAALTARLKRGLVVMDGGFSTHCEAKGADLSIGKLWSARLIADSPETIKAVHTDFMAAGSDLIGTASYQGTVRGFVDAGSTPEEAEQLLTRAVALATAARDEFWAGLGAEGRAARGAQPLVGACIGPYGGYLADGSEYSGSYGLAAEPEPEPEPEPEGEGQGGGGYGLARPQHAGSMSRAALMAFHREQVTVLAAAGADVLLFETLPCALEAAAIAELLSADFPEVTAIVSFSCKDESCLNSGEPLAPALAAIEGCDQIVAVGVNCTPPHLIAPLLRSALTATAKPFVAYGNSGEEFTSSGAEDFEEKNVGWSGEGSGAKPSDYAKLATDWLNVACSGGRGCLIGGCCRTTPEHIAAVAGACKPLAAV